MKKSFLLLPLVALSLTACNTGSSEPAQPAEVSTVGIPAWQSNEIQSVPMPSSMGNSSMGNGSMGTAMNQPTYGQPTYGQPTAVQSVPAPQPMPQATSGAEMVGNCQVVRDGANTPIYAQIQKGCYTDSSYTVGKHDTVFLVAYLSGKSVAEIAALNNLVQPYQLRTGQVLRLR